MIVLIEGGEPAAGRQIGLADGEAHHLRVRRAREGEAVGLRDGRGLVGQGRLLRAGGEWVVEVEASQRCPPAPPLVLAVGAGDRDRFGWVVEKAVELGVTAVVPLETERAGDVASRLRPTHLERLRRHALVAVKQSGNPWACRVEEPVGLRAFLDRDTAGERWLADAAGDPPPPLLDGTPCTIIVGPEGGLAESERATVLAAGYRPVVLGAHTLRFETAALAAAAAVQAARHRRTHG